ncbi:MAG: hypothetical protein HRT82_10270 [Henriciella sp.]|nr:hypothetical protein [Henriciella sp.]
MMRDAGPITIIGAPAEAWFAACLLARFAPVPAEIIRVNVRGNENAENETLIARPQMRRVHSSLGLDLAKAGARLVCDWPAGQGRSISFGAIGAPYKGVSFVSIWQRAKALKIEAGSLLDYAVPAQGFAISRSDYADALRSIALQVGVRETDRPEGTQVCVSRDVGGNADTRKLGAAALPISLTSALTLLALERSVRAWIDCWPWTSDDVSVCAAEFERRLELITSPLEDMQSLLLEGPQGVSEGSLAQHRIALWRQLGRIAPIDHDLFEPQEWIAALMLSGVTPEGGERLAQSLTVEEIKAHLDAVRAREIAHAE